jgi:hypothetical protein
VKLGGPPLIDFTRPAEAFLGEPGAVPVDVIGSRGDLFGLAIGVGPLEAHGASQVRAMAEAVKRARLPIVWPPAQAAHRPAAKAVRPGFHNGRSSRAAAPPPARSNST